jgi:restriction system protein
MPRYWVIAPYESTDELFARVWDFDVANNTISIGWSELGDVSMMDSAAISATVEEHHAQRTPQTKSLFTNMLWRFYHQIAPGDFVVARKGLKILLAVGRVKTVAQYTPNRNPLISHPNFIDVEWLPTPRDKTFPVSVFNMITLREITESEFRSLTDVSSDPLFSSGSNEGTDQSVVSPAQFAFVLEKYLEEFIVSNFGLVFNGQMRMFADDQLGTNGQQYPTDVGPIDILAQDVTTKSFVVIELKKGRGSDQVVWTDPSVYGLGEEKPLR